MTIFNAANAVGVQWDHLNRKLEVSKREVNVGDRLQAINELIEGLLFFEDKLKTPWYFNSYAWTTGQVAVFVVNAASACATLGAEIVETVLQNDDQCDRPPATIAFSTFSAAFALFSLAFGGGFIAANAIRHRVMGQAKQTLKDARQLRIFCEAMARLRHDSGDNPDSTPEEKLRRCIDALKAIPESYSKRAGFDGLMISSMIDMLPDGSPAKDALQKVHKDALELERAVPTLPDKGVSHSDSDSSSDSGSDTLKQPPPRTLDEALAMLQKSFNEVEEVIKTKVNILECRGMLIPISLECLPRAAINKKEPRNYDPRTSTASGPLRPSAS